MNIWILNHYAVAPDMPGGTRHFDFGVELLRLRHQVTVFSSSFHYSKLSECKLGRKDTFKIEYHNGIRFVWVKSFPYRENNWRRVLNMLSYSWRVYRLVGSMGLEKPHMIIGSSVHLFAVLAAYLLSKRFRSCFVMEVRDIWPQTLIDLGVSKWHPFVIVLGLLEKFLYRRAKKIITLLPGAAEHIGSLGIPERKIVWIPNGVDLRRCDVERGMSRSGGDFVVMYAGAFGSANDLGVVIRCAGLLSKSLPQIKFVLIGNGPEKPNLVKMARGMELSNVEFKGLVPKEEIHRHLSDSSVLFFNLKDSPVFRFGISSNKLFDYLASGKPVIFSCNAGNNPVAEAGAGISVAPNDPKALAEAIVKLYRMPAEEREKMGKCGREYVKKHHDISLLAGKLNVILKEAWEEKSGVVGAGLS